MSLNFALAVEELAQYQPAALPKPRQLEAMLALDAAFSGPRDALLVGADLPAQRQLESVGFRVDLVRSIEAAISNLVRRQYSVVLVAVHVEADADGLRFVRAIKRARSVYSDALVAVRRHWVGPQFPETPHWAIIALGEGVDGKEEEQHDGNTTTASEAVVCRA